MQYLQSTLKYTLVATPACSSHSGTVFYDTYPDQRNLDVYVLILKETAITL